MTKPENNVVTLAQIESRLLLAENALVSDAGSWRGFWQRHKPELVVGGGVASGFLLGLLNERLPLRMAASAIGAAGFRIVGFAARNLVAAVQSARASNNTNNNH